MDPAGVSLPPLMAYPPASVRKSIKDTDWVMCLTAWTSILKLYLVADKATFSRYTSSKDSLVVFITTYLQYQTTEKPPDSGIEMTQALELRQNVFRSLHRIILESPSLPESFLTWKFLGDASRMYRSSENMRKLLQQLWNTHRKELETSFAPVKANLIQNLGSKSFSIDEKALAGRIIPLMHTSPDLSLYMMTGSDLLDTLALGYTTAPSAVKSDLVVFVFLGLSALMGGETSNHSLLLDHLYSLKENAQRSKDSNPSQQPLLVDLVNKTPFISRMKKRLAGNSSSRVQNLTASLESLRLPQGSRPKKHIRRKIDKGKGRPTDDFGHQAMNGVHVHKMSLISQVQDLFPDFGSAFVAKLLDNYGDDVEQVTAHLLDDSLPADLATADRTEQLQSSHLQDPDIGESLEPRPTPPPSPPARQRRNVFDDDDFDRLAVKTSNLHIGRKNQNVSADKLLAEREDPSSTKAAIMSALAAFDLDDDERDDTYDAEDVGGTVDAVKPGGADEPDAGINDMREKNEETLFSAFKMSPQVFERDSATRRSQARQALRSETDMTHEAIEGWALTLKRDPRKFRQLEMKYTTYGGDQRALASTRWQSTPDGSTENSEASGAEGSGQHSRGRGGGQGRGRGRGRGGRGASVAGPADDKNTQQARDRKEQNKGSRANHNRRDQRAKKMARGGLPG